MQRLISALVTLLSLLAANLMPATAQDASYQTALTAPTAGVLELPANRTVPSLVVHDTQFILEGQVKEDVLAINCQTIIKPGARVGNYLTAIGGSVRDENNGKVRFVQQSDSLLASFGHTYSTSIGGVSVTVMQAQTKAPVQQGNWVGGQFALFLIGVLSGLIALIVAPRATERTGEVLQREPARCLVVGTLGVVTMLVALGTSYGLMRSPLGIVATPLCAAFALFCLGVLLFGWVCGLRYSGQWMARWMRRTSAVGLFLQFLLGLTVFFLVNALVGSVSHGLGVMGLLVEFLLAIAGLGAGLLSGFGTDPNWLTARMRGEVHWLSRTPRL